MRLFAAISVISLFAACGATPIRVNGVVRDSPEMRPLRNVPLDSYKQLRMLVRPGGSGAECGVAPLEGTSEADQRNNAVCVPAEATNQAVGMVRQRLRSYGVEVAKDANELFDYEVRVLVTGIAPRRPDPMAAKAYARLTFARHERPTGFFAGLDDKAATEAFESVVRDCALKDSDLTTFSASSSEPMTPEFDLSALVGDAVDAGVGCTELARFFREAHTRFAKAAPPPGPTPQPAPAP
jgi:hypothetical protein